MKIRNLLSPKVQDAILPYYHVKIFLIFSLGPFKILRKWRKIFDFFLLKLLRISKQNFRHPLLPTPSKRHVIFERTLSITFRIKKVSRIEPINQTIKNDYLPKKSLMLSSSPKLLFFIPNQNFYQHHFNVKSDQSKNQMKTELSESNSINLHLFAVQNNQSCLSGLDQKKIKSELSLAETGSQIEYFCLNR